MRVDPRTLPIFPLDLVLFPRQELALNIFEPRYKQMVEDCTLGDGLFGVCLVGKGSVAGWQAPVKVGTTTKIVKCQDEGLDGLRLHIDTVGRNRFRILDTIPPSVEMPPDYDPSTLEGHRRFGDEYERAGPGKMYIRAHIDTIPDIDQNITGAQWELMVDAWKEMTRRRANRQLDSQSLDALLRQYYLATDTPTLDYVYSLAALGAAAPQELQPVLEANTAADLVRQVTLLMGAQ